MTALDIQLQVRYDFLGYLFARTGLNYAMKFSGGETTWKGRDGQKQSQTWDYSHLIIPITVGLNLPIGEKFNAYAGLSMAWVSGGWSVELSRTYMSSSTGYAGGLIVASGALQGDATKGAFGGVAAYLGGQQTRAKEKIEFETSGVSYGYVLGFSAEVYQNVNAFVEVESMVYADYNRYDVSNAGFRYAGITHLNKFVVVGGSFVRFGATYNFGFATI
ncbi:MAG: hypothetical protein KBA61_04150 [Spirochaetes bacterium]|nr:hypothetical protein [Spirochaetota bacterium]